MSSSCTEPVESVVGAHVHLWDPRFIRYPWLDGNGLLNRPYLPGDYRAATTHVPIEAMVVRRDGRERRPTGGATNKPVNLTAE